MISIIICSRHKKPTVAFAKNIAETIGVEHEIIHIDNSKNEYSIFSAYNKGISLSKYPNLCFVHEDVKFHSEGWGLRVIEQLLQPHVGIIGLAGRDIISRVPASWPTRLDSANIIQSYPGTLKPSKKRHLPADYTFTRRSAVVLDGVFLCMNRHLTKAVSFDESLTGFHGYDFDICIQSIVSGHRNFVIYDIELEHFSKGKPNADYYRNLIIIFKKWSQKLPLFTENLTKLQQQNINKTEKKGLLKLTQKLVRRGFNTQEIVREITFFSNLINSEKNNILSKIVPLHIKISKLLNYPVDLFRSK